MKSKEELIKAFSEFLNLYSEGVQTSPVYKSTLVEEELREATWVVLAPEEYDLHNHIYSEEEIRKGYDNYETTCGRANLHHMFMASDKDVFIKKSWITEEDLVFGDVTVKKGSWLQTWKILNDDIWKGVKEGFYTGLSIQCLGIKEDIE